MILMIPYITKRLKEVNPSILCVFILATYKNGQPTESSSWFYKWPSKTLMIKFAGVIPQILGHLQKSSYLYGRQNQAVQYQ